MNNEKIQFKTNINCNGCVTAVKPHLDAATGISEWTVDTNNKDKVLTATLNGITGEDVVAIVKKAGFNIKSITN